MLGEGLQPCPFRLFQIIGKRHDGTVELQLHEGSDAHDTPYVAVSYSWNGQAQTELVHCNDKPLRVTPSLREFLVICEELQEEPHRLWVDQICISQHGVKDKERQVPLMDTYFSQAELVAIWLGPATIRTDIAFHLMEEAHEALEQQGLIRSAHLRNEIPSFLRDAETTYLFCQGLREILVRPWFSRLWTMQEVLLAGNVVFQCGSRYNHMSHLLERLGEGGLFQLLFPDDREILNAILIALEIRTFASTHTHPTIYILMEIARRKSCARAVDKVYGLLSLAKPCCRMGIKVQYSDTGLEAYAPVWTRWAQLSLSEAFSLDSISSYEWTPDLRLPPWCCNLNSPLLATFNVNQRSFHAGGMADQKIGLPTHFASTRDERGIILSGFCVDAVRQVVRRHAKGTEEEEIAQFVTDAWAIARRVDNNEGEAAVAFLRTVTMDDLTENDSYDAKWYHETARFLVWGREEDQMQGAERTEWLAMTRTHYVGHAEPEPFLYERRPNWHWARGCARRRHGVCVSKDEGPLGTERSI